MPVAKSIDKLRRDKLEGRHWSNKDYDKEEKSEVKDE